MGFGAGWSFEIDEFAGRLFRAKAVAVGFLVFLEFMGAILNDLDLGVE